MTADQMSRLLELHRQTAVISLTADERAEYQQLMDMAFALTTHQ